MTDIFELLKGKPEDSDYKNKGVIVQGITGSYGSLHAQNMIKYGTNVVAGVTPGKGGQSWNDSVPIYNTMKEAVEATGAKISIIFVPAKFFLSAGREALEAGIKLLVAIPEHVPVRDTMELLDIAEKKGAVIIGPNTPGIMIPELIKIGIMPAMPFKAGNIAVLSKSGTLLYEISDALTNSGFGQCITVGIGGDPINGTRLIDAFDMVKDIPDLEGLVIVGEIGGDSEEMLAQKIIDSGFKKPTVAYIA
ncbi:MAG: succinate--CoA ligase subunit alpha, partial [Nitrosopumilus sp.]|nr:succinate--CoA ligase subunit alpha [Nitrosopumilus sp.]